MKRCTKCKEKQSESAFYSNKNNQEVKLSWCKKCTTKKRRVSSYLFKKKCLEYSGNACSKCGYNKCQSALDFHHINPEEKEFTISQLCYLNYQDNVDVIEKELDKCILLCSNCHREEHSDEDYLNKIADDYKTREISKNYCLGCNKKIKNQIKRCGDCHLKNKQSHIPSREDLIKDKKELKYFTAIAKKYNVSDNAVRKWFKKRNIRV